MTYTWPFNSRPYTNDEAGKLLSAVVSPETADWHYNKHHQGYVVALNAIEKGLEKASKDGVNGNYAEYAELKRRQPFNHAGTVLHDTYWKNLAGDGDATKAPSLKAAIEQHFGSFDAWKADFVATAMSAKLSGWGVLTFDRLYSGRLLNILVDEHQNGAIWGGVPIIAVDMFEHAYYHKDGPARPAYINNFLTNIHWARAEEIYLKYCK